MGNRHAVFDIIYSSDLVYKKDCWKLCGDAHCCHFSRYKPEENRGTHEIPLLPGEWEYLSTKGHLNQYRDYKHAVLNVDLKIGRLKYESLKIPTQGCPCDHNRRPTICRLYPLLPRYDYNSGFIGVDTEFFIPEIVERFIGVPPACRVAEVPFAEMEKLFAICKAIENDPVMMFYFAAADVVKTHIRVGLKEKVEEIGLDTDTAAMDESKMRDNVWATQLSLMMGQLVDWDKIKIELNELGGRFRTRFGEAFKLD